MDKKHLGLNDYDFSAFDNKNLKIRAKFSLWVKKITIAVLIIVILLGLFLPESRLLLSFVVPFMFPLTLFFLYLYRPKSLQGTAFAEQNKLNKAFLKKSSYYYFVYNEYQKIFKTSLLKGYRVSWSLPVKGGEMAIAFLPNLDVFAWGRLKNSFPHIVLDSTGNNRLVGNNIDKNNLPLQEIKLEGDFPKFFRVFVEQGEHIVALQVLDPGRMARFIDHSCYFDVEIVGEHIKIYGVNIQEDSATMKLFYEAMWLLGEDLKLQTLGTIKTGRPSS